MVVEDATALVSANASLAVAPVVPAGAMFFPSEQVLLLAMPLPAMTPSQRRAAVAFAAEEYIARPVDEVHVALGPEIDPDTTPGIWLVGVVDHSLLAAPARASQAAGLRLIPDVLAVPVPPSGSWAVWTLPTRVLVRLPDGTGFATALDSFATLWHSAGALPLVAYAGSLPPGVAEAAIGLVPSTTDRAAQSFDLATGRYAQASSAWRRNLTALTVVVTVAAVAITAIRFADGIALSHIADARERALSAALVAAGQPAAGDTDVAVARLIELHSGTSKVSFLPLLARVSDTLLGGPGGITMPSIAWSNKSGELALTLDAGDLATLQAIQARLQGAGLLVSAGAATTGDGGAEVRMTIRQANS